MEIFDKRAAPGIGELPWLTDTGGETLPALDPRAATPRQTLIDANRIAYPAIAPRGARRDGAGLAAGGAVALFLGAVTFWGLSNGRQEGPAKGVPAAPGTENAPVQAPAPQGPQGQAEVLTAEPATGGSLIFSAPPQPVQLAPGTTPQPGTASGLAQRYRSPSLIVDLWGPPPTGPASQSDPSAASEPPTIAGAASKGTDEFTARADASAADVETATRMANPGHTVSQGTLIPAVLETAINSDLPGYVRAVVSQDVRSFDGKRVLIPRSSRLIGQYRSGLSAGQTRAYVLWSRLIRPDGVSVAIASPAADEAGRAGLAGQVDGHFFKRFGSALLLSVVEAASAVGTGGASLLVSRGGAAGVAAQQNGAIPPTIRVNQGQLIRVFTARDLDFGRVAEMASR